MPGRRQPPVPGPPAPALAAAAPPALPPHAAAPAGAGAGHGVGEAPDHVPPGDDLADIGLHPAERPRAGDLGGLDEEAGDEVALYRAPGAAADGGAGAGAGR